MIDIREYVRLAELTTIGLGGPARYFVSCTTVDQLREALSFGKEKNLRIHILAGGSNVIFPDEGFDGLVLRINLPGVQVASDGESATVKAAAGENWDNFVVACIEQGLGGIECLSGIPGSVGATPIQNVGAYGQEVSDTIMLVNAINRDTLEEVAFTNPDCAFDYRTSRFNSSELDRYVLTGVVFRLRRRGRPELRYPELKKYVESSVDLSALPEGRPALLAVREAVLALRKKKSMVIDPHDPNSRSVGSFFKNPVLSNDEFAELEGRWTKSSIPTFPAPNGIKVPAAWLVEQAGFSKGYTMGGVGISANHSLALINCGGTSKELVELASLIQKTVFQRFGVRLAREPVLVT